MTKQKVKGMGYGGSDLGRLLRMGEASYKNLPATHFLTLRHRHWAKCNLKHGTGLKWMGMGGGVLIG